MLDSFFSNQFETMNFTIPRIHFGTGRFNEIPSLLSESKNILLITGKSSFRTTNRMQFLADEFKKRNIMIYDMTVSGEPSPKTVDDAVNEFHMNKIDHVLAVGGGSVLDAAKAISGLLPFGNSVMDHLEGVGRGIEYSGPALPFTAVPTTAGTGSEATKNAVLSVQGENGFKKSFRHDSLVPRTAVVDPELLETCTPDLIASNGMDAFTQLLESFVSVGANPLTDALAWSGLKSMKDSLLPAYQLSQEGGLIKDKAVLTGLSYGSLLSGITLAHAGLGSVHGLASPLGAFFPIPHGIVCGTLASAAAKVNIQALQKRDVYSAALEKYARVGLLLSGKDPHDLKSQEARLDVLIEILSDWTEQMNLPRLNQYGIKESDFERITAGARGNSMKTNPVILSDEEIKTILKERL